MDDLLQMELERLSRELTLGPPRAELLIERLILAALRRDFTSARSDLAALQRLGAGRRMSAALMLLAYGRYRALAGCGLYVLYDPTLGPGLGELALHAVQQARDEADRFLGPSISRLVVELAPRRPVLDHATYEAPGVGFFKLSPRCTPSTFAQLIAHELAHLHFASGNRFLDEGVALLFQSRGIEGPLYLGPESPVDFARPIRSALPLRALLAYDGRRDADFAQLAASREGTSIAALHAMAHRLAGHVFERLRLDGLQSLATQLRVTRHCAAHPAILAHALGEEVECTEAQLFTLPEANASADPAHRSLGQGSLLLPCAHVPREALDGHIARLRHLLASSPARTEAKAALARALVCRLMPPSERPPTVDIVELRSLVHDLHGEGRLIECERLLLDGWLALAETRAAPDSLSRALAWEHAFNLLRTLLVRFMDEGEVLCLTAAANLYGPPELGADRALAHACLTRARRLEDWREAADALERACTSVTGAALSG